MNERIFTWLTWAKRRGMAWVVLYGVYRLGESTMRMLENFLIRLEFSQHIEGEDTLSARGLSPMGGQKAWDTYDWSQRGEEWTRDAYRLKGISPKVWKRIFVGEAMDPYFNLRRKQVVLEIGPGAGRWTSLLVTRASRLILVDISRKALQLCRKRFRRYRQIHYHLVSDQSLSFVKDASVDFVWSYDVFVHLSPNVISSYLDAIERVLVPGGIAVIHHAGSYVHNKLRERGLRSWMTAGFFAALVRRSRLSVVTQNTTISHFPGDIVSVVTKASIPR